MSLYCSKGHENSNNSKYCQQCGELLPMPTPGSQGFMTGLVLGDRYRILQELGHGGFGRTYLAVDLNRFQERCVLKEFAPKVQGTYALQKAEELFAREAGVLYRLKHPQIPNFRELFRVQVGGQGQLFLVQDYVEGETYRHLLDQRKRQGLRFSEPEILQLLLQLLPVLDYIHSIGVIHRDISPDNLMLRHTDQLPVLIDFGGVKQVAATVESQYSQSAEDGGTLIPTRLGKVGYAPDEQMQRGIVFPHSDLYALAATVLVLLTGKEPKDLIDGNTLTWAWRREINLSPNLGNILDRMLAQRPGDRFASAAEVLQALNPAAPVYPPVYQPPVPQSPPYQPPVQPPVTPPPSPATEATRAIVPPRPAAPTPPQNPDPRPQPQPLPVNSDSGIGGLIGKTLLVALVIVGATGLGWWGGNVLLKKPVANQPDNVPPTETPTESPTTPQVEDPLAQYSPEERQRKEALRTRRQNLGLNFTFYTALVNQIFRAQNPDFPQRDLTSNSSDERARQQWDEQAGKLLDLIENANLSDRARRRMGNYSQDDRNQWAAAVNQQNLSTRALNDLTDARYRAVAPDYTAQTFKLGFDAFLNRPIGQLWHAIAADKVQEIQNGTALEKINFAPGTTSKEVSGSLKPGEGKAYIAQLSAGQIMDVNLDGDARILLSVYPPSSKFNPLLEDSQQRTLSSRSVEHNGYYEFVVVSTAKNNQNYRLNLTVENPEIPSPEPIETPTETPTETPIPETTP